MTARSMVLVLFSVAAAPWPVLAQTPIRDLLQATQVARSASLRLRWTFR